MRRTAYLTMHGDDRMTLREARAALETITDALALDLDDENRRDPARRARDKLAAALERAKRT